MGGIADERDAVGDEGARNKETERMHAPRADHLDVAEMQLEALFKLGVEGVVRQRHDALGFARLLGPDDRGAAAFERQDCERSCRKKVLLGAPVMIAFMLDVDHDGGLAVIPAMSGDAGGARGSSSARRRRRREGASRSRRRHSDATQMIDVPRSLRGRKFLSTAAALSSTPTSRAFASSASTSLRFSIMWANGSPGSISPRKGEKDRPHRIVEPAVGDDHVEDRLRIVGDALPNADGLEQPARRRHDGRGAFVARVAYAKRRIGDHDGKGRSQRLPQARWPA